MASHRFMWGHGMLDKAVWISVRHSLYKRTGAKLGGCPIQAFNEVVVRTGEHYKNLGGLGCDDRSIFGAQLDLLGESALPGLRRDIRRIPDR